MPGNSVTVLIVDDDPLIRSAYKCAFEQRGYHVLVAEDGVRALATAEIGKVDFVLLDVLMPRKEGLETLIELKHRYPNIVVFVMTGGLHSKTDFLTIATKFGADAVLKKPFEPQTVIDLMAGRTSESRQQNG